MYAIRWEGRNDKSGYSPAGDKEWDKAPSFGRGPKKSFRITKLFSLTETGVPSHLNALGKRRSCLDILRRTLDKKARFGATESEVVRRKLLKGFVACRFEPQFPAVSTQPLTLKNLNNIGRFLTIARLPGQSPDQLVKDQPQLRETIVDYSFAAHSTKTIPFHGRWFIETALLLMAPTNQHMGYQGLTPQLKKPSSDRPSYCFLSLPWRSNSETGLFIKWPPGNPKLRRSKVHSSHGLPGRTI